MNRTQNKYFNNMKDSENTVKDKEENPSTCYMVNSSISDYDAKNFCSNCSSCFICVYSKDED